MRGGEKYASEGVPTCAGWGTPRPAFLEMPLVGLLLPHTQGLEFSAQPLQAHASFARRETVPPAACALVAYRQGRPLVLHPMRRAFPEAGPLQRDLLAHLRLLRCHDLAGGQHSLEYFGQQGRHRKRFHDG